MNECMKSIRVRSSVNKGITRRQLLRGAACTIAGVVVSKLPDSSAAPGQSVELAGETLAFIRRCARADGGYDPSPDPATHRNSPPSPESRLAPPHDQTGNDPDDDPDARQVLE